MHKHYNRIAFLSEQRRWVREQAHGVLLTARPPQPGPANQSGEQPQNKARGSVRSHSTQQHCSRLPGVQQRGKSKRRKGQRGAFAGSEPTTHCWKGSSRGGFITTLHNRVVITGGQQTDSAGSTEHPGPCAAPGEGSVQIQSVHCFALGHTRRVWASQSVLPWQV